MRGFEGPLYPNLSAAFLEYRARSGPRWHNVYAFGPLRTHGVAHKSREHCPKGAAYRIKVTFKDPRK